MILFNFEIPQETFNKFITTSLMFYCMIMFSLAWYTGKNLDLQGFITLLTPLLAHTVHLIAQNRVVVRTIDATVQNGNLADNTKAVEANTKATILAVTNGEKKA